MKDKKTRPSIIEAFNAAIQGIIYTFKYERNMKIHYIIAVAVLIISLRFDLNKFEMMILILSISLVIISEMFNTAIENTVDLVTDKYHYDRREYTPAAAVFPGLASENRILPSKSAKMRSDGFAPLWGLRVSGWPSGRRSGCGAARGPCGCWACPGTRRRASARTRSCGTCARAGPCPPRRWPWRGPRGDRPPCARARARWAGRRR